MLTLEKLDLAVTQLPLKGAPSRRVKLTTAYFDESNEINIALVG